MTVPDLRAARGAAPAALTLAIALGLALTGCPLPQALPDYPSTGAITPPRIRADATTPSGPILEVHPACATPPAVELSTSVVDENTIEIVEPRWFVDYATTGPNSRPQAGSPILGPENGLDTIRPVPPWTFTPYDYDPGTSAADKQAFRDGGGLHVVELVVSNQFEKDGVPVARPNRTAAAGFETQVYRWTFHYTPEGACSFTAAP